MHYALRAQQAEQMLGSAADVTLRPCARPRTTHTTAFIRWRMHVQTVSKPQVMVNQKIKEIQDRPFRSIYEDSKGQLWRDPVVPARQQHVMHALFLLGKENE
jgi:hypothetical protein